MLVGHVLADVRAEATDEIAVRAVVARRLVDGFVVRREVRLEVEGHLARLALEFLLAGVRRLVLLQV